MKKLLATLAIFLSLVACSPKFYYFSRETTCPQCVVDSLMNPNPTQFRDWTGFQSIGINQGDSTIVTTYVNALNPDQVITVILYNNSDSSTVTEKRRKK